jgi:hypothetical protein
MHPQLAALLSDFEESLDRVQRLDRNCSETEWSHRPSEVGWSAAECITHLNLTSEAYLPLLRKGIERARGLSDAVPRHFRRDLTGWLVWRASTPEVKMRVKTTRRFVPLTAPARAELIREFYRLQQEQMNFLQAADGLPIHRVKIVSPFNSRLKYSLYSTFTILPAHQLRHIGQAERALADAKKLSPAPFSV